MPGGMPTGGWFWSKPKRPREPRLLRSFLLGAIAAGIFNLALHLWLR
jgi:hypothetical protein